MLEAPLLRGTHANRVVMVEEKDQKLAMMEVWSVGMAARISVHSNGATYARKGQLMAKMFA